MTLGDVINDLEKLQDETFILVPCGITLTPQTPAELIAIPEQPDADLGVPGMDYWIETFLAKDVIEAWMEWRNGNRPTTEEAIQAITYYKEHDDYIPTNPSTAFKPHSTR